VLMFGVILGGRRARPRHQDQENRPGSPHVDRRECKNRHAVTNARDAARRGGGVTLRPSRVHDIRNGFRDSMSDDERRLWERLALDADDRGTA
jgi:hypothetical protein